ncbi:hypothetical protein A9Q83_15225 [Alphaproteobacteria bacterium 46_93_T64]|nr:hypothetical protein A9Q83_15225 [Alphaproteobacteria bacterium 46_93_T64]
MTGIEPSSILRAGPRPLGLHLSLSTLSFGSSLGALSLAKNGTLAWLPELQEEAEKIQAQLGQFEVAELALALGDEGQRLLSQMMSGIKKYQTHPYLRNMPTPPTVWSKGSMSLFDYGGALSETAPVVFLVPSLINRSYILDLMPGRSFVAALADAGIRPLLVDWGTPGPDEKEYGLDNYLLDVLSPALDFAAESFPKAPLHLAGYCMGGTLATALAQFKQDKIASLITIAAPWDFHEGLGQSARAIISNPVTWETILQTYGELPVDVIQSLFANLDPNLCLNKFSLFDQMVQTEKRAETFVALEDWLNDGIPLVKNVAYSCFIEWYGENRPALCKWLVRGEVINPEYITIPSMIVVPRSDRIVPPGSARALAQKIPNASLVTPPSGHIGMVVGSSASKGLWANMLQWVSSQ